MGSKKGRRLRKIEICKTQLQSLRWEIQLLIYRGGGGGGKREGGRGIDTEGNSQ